MNEKNKAQVPNKAVDDNPYLTNRNDWTEIIAKEKAEKVMWRLFALLELIPMTVAICGMIYASQLPDVIPFIFKEDASGGIVALGIPNKEFKADNAAIANQLQEFVVALRQVPGSEAMRKISVHHVKVMSDPMLFRNQLGNMLREEYTALGTGEQLVTINAILPEPTDKYTWEIDWTEDKTGGVSAKYKALITYTQLPRFGKNPVDSRWNPLNIAIKDININQVMGGKQ